MRIKYKMDTIFMDSENSKTNNSYNDKCVALSILSMKKYNKVIQKQLIENICTNVE